MSTSGIMIVPSVGKSFKIAIGALVATLVVIIALLAMNLAVARDELAASREAEIVLKTQLAKAETSAVSRVSAGIRNFFTSKNEVASQEVVDAELRDTPRSLEVKRLREMNISLAAEQLTILQEAEKLKAAVGDLELRLEKAEKACTARTSV